MAGKNTSTTKLHPQAERRIREVVRRREAREAEAAKWNGPHCMDCGGERIAYLYMDRTNGTVIEEDSALGMACSIIGDAINDETEDPSWLAELAHTQHELAVMWKVRPDSRAETAAE